MIDTKLCFIYNITNEFNYNDTNFFENILKKINKNINYILVLLIEEEDKYVYLQFKNYLKIFIFKTFFKYKYST
jgi:hypothetical protein